MGNLTGQPTVAHAFSRFGFGGRPDDAVPANIADWLSAQISGPDPAPASLAPTLAAGLGLLALPESPGRNGQGRTSFRNSLQALVTYAVTTTTPFRERLVWFWFNQFAIMAEALPVCSVAAQYTRDAIRANVTGTFAQLLQAAILHPAMIYSLNANASIGPQSTFATWMKKKGIFANINENLARETLELYSVGVAAGYTQADVDALAYLMSGLNVNFRSGMPLGTFYDSKKQQPGSQTVLGQTFPGTEAGLLAALTMLGTHPAAYQNIATKLVTHFVADTPEAADIAMVANALASSGGNLQAAYQALIALPNAWIPLQKLRTPAELVIATLRAANITAANMPANIHDCISVLGQRIWQPPFPNGWPDTAANWLGAQSMLLRGDWASGFAAGMTGATLVQAVQSSIGPLLSASTASVLRAVPNAQAQLGLFFCCSEFQRR